MGLFGDAHICQRFIAFFRVRRPMAPEDSHNIVKANAEIQGCRGYVSRVRADVQVTRLDSATVARAVDLLQLKWNDGWSSCGRKNSKIRFVCAIVSAAGGRLAWSASNGRYCWTL